MLTYYEFVVKHNLNEGFFDQAKYYIMHGVGRAIDGLALMVSGAAGIEAGRLAAGFMALGEKSLEQVLVNGIMFGLATAIATQYYVTSKWSDWAHGIATDILLKIQKENITDKEEIKQIAAAEVKKNPPTGV